MRFLHIFWFFFLVILIGCSQGKSTKNTENEGKENTKVLPNYGNINLHEIFSPYDSYLPNRPQIVHDIDSFYKKVWEKGNLSGGILVAKGSDILYEKYRGFARENDSIAIDNKTPMHVASVSKPLTTVAILKLVEAGKIQLDEPLTKIFPKFPYPKITIEMMLQHRSGLPRYEYFLEKADVPEEHFINNQFILDFMIKNKPELALEPDTGFMYSNTNFALLALVVEKITQTPFPKAMEEMVFRPLKMDHTYVFQEKDIPTASQSFFWQGRKLYPLNYLDLICGDKNVYTTPRDLYNFSKALYSKKFLNPELKELIFKPYSNEHPGINNYGLGFRMKIFDNGEKLTYHTGWWHGSNAVFAHLLKSKVTIVAIGNVFSGSLYSTLALSGLFEDFPMERAQLENILNINVQDENFEYLAE